MEVEDHRLYHSRGPFVLATFVVQDDEHHHCQQQHSKVPLAAGIEYDEHNGHCDLSESKQQQIVWEEDYEDEQGWKHDRIRYLLP